MTLRIKFRLIDIEHDIKRSLLHITSPVKAFCKHIVLSWRTRKYTQKKSALIIERYYRMDSYILKQFLKEKNGELLNQYAKLSELSGLSQWDIRRIVE